MGQVLFTRPRGATLRFEFLDPDAAFGDEAKITVKLAILAPGARTLTADAAESAATLTIAYRAATDDVPVGWTAELSAALSQGLPGNRHYQLDGKRTDGALVIPFVDPAILYLREPAFA